MDWILIGIGILSIEILIVALLWDKISELMASYSLLIQKGQKALEEGNLEKAKNIFTKLVNNKEFLALSDDNPLKHMGFRQLIDVYVKLADTLADRTEGDSGEEYYSKAIIYKVQELQLTGEWDDLKDRHQDIVQLKRKLAQAYRQNNSQLTEALAIFFAQGDWESYIQTYNQLKKQVEYVNLSPEEIAGLDSKNALAESVLKYKEGASKIVNGKAKSGKKDIDEALTEVREVLNHHEELRQVDEEVFNKIKEQLGLLMVDEIQNEQVQENQPMKEDEKKRKEEIDDWNKTLEQMRRQSRVVSNVTERPGEVIVEVQTEWYLLPLIFQEELVKRVSATYYNISKKKEGTLFFIFKDSKNREVARHTPLGVRIYN